MVDKEKITLQKFLERLSRDFWLFRPDDITIKLAEALRKYVATEDLCKEVTLSYYDECTSHYGEHSDWGGFGRNYLSQWEISGVALQLPILSPEKYFVLDGTELREYGGWRDMRLPEIWNDPTKRSFLIHYER